MIEICEQLRTETPEVIRRWEQLVREMPWFSLPREHRIDDLPAVVLGLVEVSLCSPTDRTAHWQQIAAAAEHGYQRREQGLPEHLIFTEYHLLRQAIWYHLCATRAQDYQRVTQAIMRIDTAVTTATNASMWGYHRPEVEAHGVWGDALRRLVDSSPFLRGGPLPDAPETTG